MEDSDIPKSKDFLTERNKTSNLSPLFACRKLIRQNGGLSFAAGNQFAEKADLVLPPEFDSPKRRT